MTTQREDADAAVRALIRVAEQHHADRLGVPGLADAQVPDYAPAGPAPLSPGDDGWVAPDVPAPAQASPRQAPQPSPRPAAASPAAGYPAGPGHLVAPPGAGPQAHRDDPAQASPRQAPRGRRSRQRDAAAPAGQPRRSKRGHGPGSVEGIADGQTQVPAPRRGRRPAAEYDHGLAAQAIHENLVFTDKQVIAWFVLPAEPWSFRPPAQRASVITAHATRMAQLVGRRCFIRVTTHPFPVRDWAASFDHSISERHPVMPGPCRTHPYRSEAGCPDCVPGQPWYDWLASQQRRVHGWGTDDKVVYLGVELDGRGGLNRLLGPISRKAANAELTGFAAKRREVAAAVSGAGLRGRPATSDEMQWLMARSCWLHMPAPRKVRERREVMPYALTDSPHPTFDRADLAQFTEGVSWTAAPFGRTVAITRADGLTRYVAVLTVGEGMTGEDIPGDSPWLQRTDLLPFPVEWAVTVNVRDRKAVAGEMHKRIAEIKNQAQHFAEHSQPMPPAMNRQFEAARRLEDESENSGAMAGRTEVWARIAVGGATETEALERAGRVAELYSPGIPIIQPPDQYNLAKEFIPGEDLSSTAHCRYMPAVLLAAGMPNATSRIGRRDGFPVGRTVSLTTRAVTLHPWRDMEQLHRSGLWVVTGTLGSGKSNFGGLFAYMAVRAGIATVIMDPSGLLDRLCTMPELAAHSSAVNLLQSPPGTLSPYALIADPRREDFDVDDRGQRRDPGEADLLWDQAREAAQVSRRELAEEILRMLLPAEMRGEKARAVLTKATELVPADTTASLRDVLEAMRGIGDDYGVGHNGAWMADQYQKLTSHPWARLFFPPAAGDAGQGDVTATGRLLTVMTLRGLVQPDRDTPPEQYTNEQRMSVPIMHLAAWLARRHVMDRPRHVRKLTILDEAHMVTAGPIGQALVNETARDSRKHNHCAIWMSQRAGDLRIASVDNLIGAVLVGHTDGKEEQAAALSLLGLPADQGYEGYLSALSQDCPGQFLINDGRGLEVIQVDLEAGGQSLRAALDSTPTGRDPAAARSAPGPRPDAAARPAATVLPAAAVLAPLPGRVAS